MIRLREHGPRPFIERNAERSRKADPERRRGLGERFACSKVCDEDMAGYGSLYN